MRQIIIGILSILTLNCQSQELEYRSVEYYSDQVATLVLKGLIEQEILIDSATIANNYLEKATQGFNTEGYMKYSEIKMNIYMSFFRDYLYQQHLEYDEHIFVLYFTIAGFDDVEWDIVKWNKSDWKSTDRLSPDRLKSDSSLTKIFWNYDEGPKTWRISGCL